jgi:cytochrome c peroxidase
MKKRHVFNSAAGVTSLALLWMLSNDVNRASAGQDDNSGDQPHQKGSTDDAVDNGALAKLRDGRQIFRYDTFGDQAFWGDTLKLHQAIAGTNLGGVGPGVSPSTALAVGLKVDSDALPKSLKQQLTAGQVDLNAPATTLALLKLNAVVGVTGYFDQQRRLTSLGIQCALCHSTVDNSFAPGIGHRLDGWPNRDLNVGAIINLSPNLSPFTNALQVSEASVRSVLLSWGPGKFDAELLMDGKTANLAGKPAATLLPAAFGLGGVHLHTYTGWGSVPYWNAFVANLEMQGSGRFYDPRLNDSSTFPVAARLGFGNVRDENDLITGKLAALQLYQLALPVPEPPRGSFDAVAATRGKSLFQGKANCASCHVPPIFTEPGWNLHAPSEIGIDDFQSNRSPDKGYRTTPLGGLFTRTKGGFYHDGRFADMAAVVEHYNQFFGLNLTAQEKHDLIEYLKSI